MDKQRGDAREQKSPTGPGEAGWAGGQLSIRLTSARRGKLRKIAAGMHPGAAPRQAIDQAIELALHPVGDIAGALAARFDDLEELSEMLAADRRGEAEAARKTAQATLRAVSHIAELMSAVAAAPEDGSEEDGDLGAGERTAAALPLRAWLDARAGSGRVLAIGRWSAKRRLAGKLVAMEFEVAAEGGRGARALVCVEPLDPGDPLARCDQEDAVRFACLREARGGWSIEVHRLSPSGSAGARIGAVPV